MALGRVRHRKSGVHITGPGARYKGEAGSPAPYIYVQGSTKPKKLNVEVQVVRHKNHVATYGAQACFRGRVGSGSRVRRGRLGREVHAGRCAYTTGRTPQSAIGKALKKLGQKAALRGRKIGR